jgi:hypothetical protein
MFKLLPRMLVAGRQVRQRVGDTQMDTPPQVLSLSKDGPRAPAVVRQARHGVGGKSARRAVALWRMLACLWLLSALVVSSFSDLAEANWLSKVMGAAEHTGTRAARHGGGTLETAAAHVKALPAKADGAALAAQATQEGHWRFINKSGETFTAGTPEELKRVTSVLLPDAKADVKLSLYVTEDTIFLHRAALKDLPKGTELHVVVRNESYRIARRGEGAAERFFAEVRPNLVVEMSDRKAFGEAAWQLARPLNKSNVRVLALEPGGPPTLASAPRIDPASKRAMIDAIDPASLPAALGSVRGQTVLVTGRVDGRLLYVQPASGPERSVLVADLFKAAEEADVNLVVLHAVATPRQPGGRNWLWQKVEVKGLDQALQHARVADFFNALGGPNRRLLVAAAPSGRRASLTLKPASEFAGPVPSPVGDIFSGVVSDITGRVITAGVQANMRSAERQEELDQRFIPGIPSEFQGGYLVLVILGLFGVPVSRAWWRRLWPPEAASEYAGRAGYIAARTVRVVVFLLFFLPLTAPVSAPYALVKKIRDAAMAPVRWWRWLTGRRTAPSPS